MVSVYQVAQLMGGREVFGEPISELTVIDRIHAGLPFRAYECLLQGSPLTIAEVERVGLPRRTVTHRRLKDSFSPDQSDRLFRLARVFSMATETFGSAQKAHRWLLRETRPLEGRAPIDLLDTDEGTRLVEQLLGRITHGIAA